MSADVLAFPANAPRHAAFMPAAPRHSPVSPRREYSFADVVRLLALTGEPRTQVDYLRDLAIQCGMPLPRNPRRWAGRLQTGGAKIGRKSRWCALEFDAWIDGQRTPPPGGGIAMRPASEEPDAPRATAPLRATLRARARLLAGGS